MPTGTEHESASLEPYPATEAHAMPFARWLHKGESNSNKAANLQKPYTSFCLLGKHERMGINSLI